MAEVLSFRETVQLIQEFLEVSFHTILYIRQIYPPELFQQKKKYDNVPIWQSRNPALNDYLGRILESIGQELSKGSLKKVAFVIKEDKMEDKPLERFVWDFDWLVPEGKMPGPERDWTPAQKGLKRAQVEDEFRGFLFKLNVAESYLTPLPDDVTFTVVIELNEDASPPESDAARKGHVPNEWIPAQERYAPPPTTSSTKGKGKGKEKETSVVERDRDGASTVAPLRTARLGMINVQLMVEELEGKFGKEEDQELDGMGVDPSKRWEEEEKRRKKGR